MFRTTLSLDTVTLDDVNGDIVDVTTRSFGEYVERGVRTSTLQGVSFLTKVFVSVPTSYKISNKQENNSS